MALGSKGGNGGGGGGRGRPYGMMLLLAFGAAVLGVMILHKLRERRIFSLLIQDKDQDLMSLHLLLQKERESSQEMKRKIEDLKAKAHALRTQKMELSNKVTIIQSITSSLKEEVRVLESTLEEKQNEIKTLREKEIESSEKNSQIAALRELLKQKEDEIEELKRFVKKPTKILSVGTDDPSNHINPTLPTDEQSETLASEVDGTSNNVSEGIHAGEKKNLEKGHAGEKRVEESERIKEVSGEEKFQMVEDSRRPENFIAKAENENRNETEANSSPLYKRVLDTENEDGHMIKLDISEGGEGRLLSKMSKNGVKLKKMDRSRTNRGSKVRGEYDRKSITMSTRGRTSFRDEGLRTSSDKDETFDLKGRGKKMDEVVIQQGRGDENLGSSEITLVQQQEKTEDDKATENKVNPVLQNEGNSDNIGGASIKRTT